MNKDKDMVFWMVASLCVGIASGFIPGFFYMFVPALLVIIIYLLERMLTKGVFK